MIDLTFLGTGAAFTDFRVNYHNNAAIRLGDDAWALIDCGPTAPQALRELGIKPSQVEAILVTHMHGDHVGGIEQITLERYYGSAGERPSWRKTRLLCPAEVAPGLRSYLTPLVDEVGLPDGSIASGGFDTLFDFATVDAAFRLGGLELRFHSTPHCEGDGVRKPSYGLELRDGARASVYFTSDTTFRPGIGALFPDAARIFHDCTFAAWHPGTVHTHYEELLRLPADVRARVVLMHHTEVPPGVDPRADGFAAAARRFERFEA